MKEIGGFFEWVGSQGQEYHDRAIRVNSGRNALELLLLKRKPRMMHVPKYICNSVIDVLEKLKLPYQFYDIDASFAPQVTGGMHPNDAFLYVNYFGLQEKQIRTIARTFPHAIIDNTQAFYAKPPPELDTIYSPRKFFPVADGGYLYTDVAVETEELPQDTSYDRYLHILKRVDRGANEGYADYLENEKRISQLPIKCMSLLTQRFLQSTPYAEVATTRRRNFEFLQERLGTYNELCLPMLESQVPMGYPLLVSRSGLKQFLIDQKIYVASYWSEVLERVRSDSIEAKFANHLVLLPLDQRYTLDDMERIVSEVRRFLR